MFVIHRAAILIVAACSISANACSSEQVTSTARAEASPSNSRADRPSPADRTGLAVGEKAQAFTLKDQHGRERSLEGLTRKGKVALVFFRSADWCPFCRKQLIQLQHDLQSIESAGVQIVGISYDSVEVLKTFSDRMKITFPLLSDPESHVIDAFHVRNHEAKGRTEGIPNPGTFVLDSTGVIRAKLFLEGYRERHTTEALIEAARAIQ